MRNAIRGGVQPQNNCGRAGSIAAHATRQWRNQTSPVMKLKTISLLALLGGACVARADTHVGLSLRIGAPPPVVVREAPPRRVIVEERRIAAPGPNYVWIAAHHSWDGNRWVWVEGTWVVPPQPGAFWVEGRWDQQSRNWIEGHWEVSVQQSAPISPPPPPPAPGYATAPTGPGEIVVVEAPPPPRREVIVERDRPSRDAVWIAGYWGWDHGRHSWVAGHWEMPPRPHMTWVEPRWERRGKSYVFIRGTWR